jgi:glycosyltransferase involved in cell wall biosynthesis
LHLHAGRFVAKAIRRPFILEVNAPLAEERDVYGKLALKSFARWSDGVIWRSAQMALPVTDVLADHLRKQGVKESQITVLHNGADLSQYQQTRAQCRQQIAGIGENDVVFGFVGFIRRWHGLSKVVDFIKSRPDLPIRAIFVGDGREDKDELQLQINKLGLTDKIQITGFINRERIPTYVGAFDVALQPASTLYASPLKLFEYMAAGCAILAPATPNIKEVLKHEASGLLFDPDSIESMVDCFQHLCDDPLLRTAVGQNAKTLCKTFPYTWENNARIVVNIAEKLATKASLSK